MQTDCMTVRILDILFETTADGPGLRTSIYVAGCKHKCPGCHNPQSHDFNGGEEYSIDELIRIIKSEEPYDVTLTGGDIMFQPDVCYELVKRIEDETSLKVWIYTGFTLQECLNDPKKKRILKHIEALVDGRFIQELRTDQKPFVGSENQNIWFIKELGIAE